MKRLLVVSMMFVAFIAYGSLMPVPRYALSDTNFPGHDFRNVESAHPIACSETCLRDARCMAWTWVRPAAEGQIGRCWLKNASPVAVRDHCCFSGGRALTDKMEMGVDRPGLDYRNFVPASNDPYVCANTCFHDNRCQAWTYVKPNTTQGPSAHCWLKNAAPRPVANACCVSGGKAQ